MTKTLTIPTTPTPINLRVDVSCLPALGRHAVACFDKWSLKLPVAARQALLSDNKFEVQRALKAANQAIMARKPAPTGLPKRLQGAVRPDWSNKPFRPVRQPKLTTS